MENLVTYRYEPARPFKRFSAALIDYFLFSLIIVPALFFLVSYEPGVVGSSFFDIENIVFGMIVPAAVVLVFLFSTSASPGKLLMGLRILDYSSGGRLGKKQMSRREFFAVLSAILLFFGYHKILTRSDRRAWHDLKSGSYVADIRA